MSPVYWNLATSQFWNLRDICFFWDIWFWPLRKKNSIKLSAISRTTLFERYFADWSENLWKNSSAYRKIITVLVSPWSHSLNLQWRRQQWGPSRRGCMFPCSLWKFTVVPLFLKNTGIPQNSLLLSSPVSRNSASCSVDHQKYSSLFPTLPLIFYYFMVSYFHRFYLSHSTDTPC